MKQEETELNLTQSPCEPEPAGIPVEGEELKEVTGGARYIEQYYKPRAYKNGTNVTFRLSPAWGTIQMISTRSSGLWYYQILIRGYLETTGRRDYKAYEVGKCYSIAEKELIPL